MTGSGLRARRSPTPEALKHREQYSHGGERPRPSVWVEYVYLDVGRLAREPKHDAALSRLLPGRCHRLLADQTASAGRPVTEPMVSPTTPAVGGTPG
jgi:hypothetical protein